MKEPFSLSTRACFAPAFVQVRVRDLLVQALLPGHLDDATEVLCNDVWEHMNLTIGELSEIVDTSFVEPYLGKDPCLASYRDRLTRQDARVREYTPSCPRPVAQRSLGRHRSAAFLNTPSR